MYLHSNSWAYCDFAGSDYKYVYFNEGTSPKYNRGGNWWDPTRPIFTGPGWTTGTRSGFIDSGPYPGTSSLHLQQSDPIFAQSMYIGETPISDWVVGLWVYPINLTATRTLLIWQNSWQIPNYGSTFSLGIRADGRVQLMTALNANLNVGPSFFDPQDAGGSVVLVSNAPCVINTTAPTPGSLRGWTHICAVLNLAGSPNGFAKLFINGCNDSSVAGLNTIAANLLTQAWHNPSGPDEVCLSQFLVTNMSGATNTGQISQSATMQVVFPTGDSVAQWIPTAGAGYASVNGNPGPGSNYIQLASLATPDELFSIPSIASVRQITAVALNMCMTAPTQTVAGLFQVASQVPYPITPSLAPAVTGQWTRQAFAELNPWTGLPWAFADVGTTTWGVRGVSGISEQVYQYFLEVIGQAGPANCGGSYAY